MLVEREPAHPAASSLAGLSPAEPFASLLLILFVAAILSLKSWKGEITGLAELVHPFKNQAGTIPCLCCIKKYFSRRHCLQFFLLKYFIYR